jgi:UDP-glucuronate decarboxylase
MLTTKTILISGGAGFIGANLCEKLLQDDNTNIICVDNLLTGHLCNIVAFMNHPRFTFLQHDIIDPLLLEGPLDEIYNLACPASPEKYQKDPINTLKVNFLGVLNLLELARRKGAKFLQSSTSEIYGEPLISPQHEHYRGNVNTTGIRSCYDEGKRVAETLTFEYQRLHQVDVRIARIFNTYGPKMDKKDGRVVSNFINQALNNEPLTLYGQGEQTRCFCYIEDLLEGLVRLMATPKYHAPVNIGSTHEITVKELAELVLSLTPMSSSIITYQKLPSDDPTNRKPDTTTAKSLFQWTPLCNLTTGLKHTISWFLNNNK